MADVKPAPNSELTDFNHVEAVEVTVEAQVATADEHSLTVREALKRYPMAIFWAVVMSTTIIMEGYDATLIVNFFTFPSFEKKYGTYYPGLGYQISTPWQTGLSLGAIVGAFFALLANGYLTERFGHRKVIMVALVAMTAIVFMQFFAPSIEVLMAAQVLVGLPWGIFAIMGPTYASEVCPLVLRGYLTSFVNLCWVIGQLIGAGVLQGLVDETTKWSYKIPFAIQWVWPIPLFILTFLSPDSPWWLVRKGRIADAERSVQRLSSNLTPEEIRNSISMMVYTNRLEKEQKMESNYWDCFRSTNLRRSEIACMALCAQSFSGQVLAYSPTYFLVQAGFSTSDAYKMNFASTGIAFVFTCFSWILMSYIGRRTLFISGLSIMTCVLLVIGVLSYSHSDNATYAQGGLCLFWLALYSSTLGPQSFAIAAEVSATRLRAQTLSLARNAYYLVAIIVNVTEPYLINPTASNLKGKTALVWLGTSFLTVVWAIFRLPETRGRTYEELDLLFEKRLPAWKFSSADMIAIRGVEEDFVKSENQFC